MEPRIERRRYPREEVRRPVGISCVTCRTSGSFYATAHNISEEGLFLKTGFLLKEYDDIIIHARRYAAQGADGILFNENIGIVRWVKPILRNRRQIYEAGVKFY